MFAKPNNTARKGSVKQSNDPSGEHYWGDQDEPGSPFFLGKLGPSHPSLHTSKTALLATH